MQFLVQHPAPDPATEFVHKSTVRVPSNWISSSNVKLRLASETLVVGPLLGDNASTRSVGGELSADTATTMERDVPAETPDMSMTAALGTSTSKRLLVLSTELTKMYASAGSQASSDQPQARNFRTILLEVDVLACLSARACPRRHMQSCRARLCRAKNCTASHVFPRPLALMSDETSCQFVTFVHHVRMENDLLVFRQHLLTKH